MIVVVDIELEVDIIVEGMVQDIFDKFFQEGNLDSFVEEGRMDIEFVGEVKDIVLVAAEVDMVVVSSQALKKMLTKIQFKVIELILTEIVPEHRLSSMSKIKL